MTTAPVNTLLKRAGGLLVVGGVLLGMLTACSPSEPAPTPTKTALFPSEEEAFAAAEATYRAYNEAVNADRNDDQDANPRDFLTGQAYEASLEGERQVRDAGLRVEGDVTVTRFMPTQDTSSNALSRLRALVCLDLSNTRVVRLATGEEANIPDRPTLVAQEIVMTWVKDSYLISEELDGDEALCTGS